MNHFTRRTLRQSRRRQFAHREALLFWSAWTLILAAGLLVAMFLHGCRTPGPCTPETDLGAIELNYQAELADKCRGYGPSCPFKKEIDSRARDARTRWAQCRQ